MSAIYSTAKNLNLEILSILSLSEMNQALVKGAERLESWQERGFAAEMGYMNRGKGLFSDPRNLLPEVQSIITFAVPYYSPNTRYPEHKKGYGKVARYAWGLDYHLVLKKKLEQFVIQVQEEGPIKINKYRIFSDSVPTLERAIAEKAGIGFIGKSSMLIRPGMGSYFFICEVFLDSEICGDELPKVFKSNCGTCVNCMSACPTQAIVENKVVDAGKCISYLTIEKRTHFFENEMSAIGDWIFGCDICQEVCPYNHRGAHADVLDEFSAAEGAGPFLNLENILKLKSNEEFRKQFKNTPMLRTKRDGLLRNAMAVSFNQKDYSQLKPIINILDNDTSPFLREQAKIVLRAFKPYSTGIDRNLISACDLG